MWNLLHLFWNAHRVGLHNSFEEIDKGLTRLRHCSIDQIEEHPENQSSSLPATVYLQTAWVITKKEVRYIADIVSLHSLERSSDI